MSFKNKVVLITGSGSGIGEATALLFAEKGADVVILDIDEENAKKTGDNCKRFGHKVLVIKTDISKDDEAKRAMEQTISVFGQLDVLVNNAGIARQGSLLSGNIMNACDEVLNTNLRAVVLMTSLATPHLIKTKGCIVNTSSIFSKMVSLVTRSPLYAVSKAGVDCFTRVSALELAPCSVRVNAVNPGPVRTNLIKNSNVDSSYDDLGARTALKKCSEPPEIAELIVYLASEKAKNITGCNYDIDNGMQLV